MSKSTFPQNIPSLPAWRVILAMVRFRPWFWFVDLVSVAMFRFCSQIAPALIIKAFFDMLTGDARLTFGVWAIVALSIVAWLGRVAGGWGFYYADVPIFADIPTLLRKNLLRYILRRPGASSLPDSPGEAVNRFKNDVQEIPLFTILVNDIMVGLVIIFISISPDGPHQPAGDRDGIDPSRHRRGDCQWGFRPHPTLPAGVPAGDRQCDRLHR